MAANPAGRSELPGAGPDSVEGFTARHDDGGFGRPLESRFRLRSLVDVFNRTVVPLGPEMNGRFPNAQIRGTENPVDKGA